MWGVKEWTSVGGVDHRPANLIKQRGTEAIKHIMQGVEVKEVWVIFTLVNFTLHLLYEQSFSLRNHTDFVLYRSPARYAAGFMTESSPSTRPGLR